MNGTQRNLCKIAAVALLVTGCGGGGSTGSAGGSSGSAGGGSGSGGTPGGSTPPPTTGGSSKTVFATGAISGFGSIIVNGVHYETESARVTIDDRSGSALDLKVGEVVRIQAQVDASGKARATSIAQDRLVEGVVQSVDAAAGRLTIAGQVIIVDADTLFDDSIPTRSLAGIAVGDRIEVHGFVGPTGARATRIEKAGAAETEVEVTGVVSALNTTTKRFNVGTLVVDYGSATLEDFGAAGPQGGQIVEVKGTQFLADGALKATRVQREDHDFDGRSGDESEVEGLVTRFASVTDFDVAGQKVTTNASTLFVNGASSDLKLDSRVEVEGALDATDALVAAKVVFKPRSTARLSGRIDSINATAGTFQALGVTVVVNDSTRKDDHEGDDRFFGLDDLRVGDWVEVAGHADPAAAGRLIATRLERDEPESEVELRGLVASVGASSLAILGVTVELLPGTKFRKDDASISRADFLAQAAGKLVEADGTWNGSAIVADEVEIEMQ